MSRHIVVFGAGATGRAHVGLLAWQAGFEVVFVDRNAALVDRLRNSGCYRVRVIGDRVSDLAVTGYRIYHHLERDAVAQEVADSELVLTAVFPENFPDVAQTLARAIGRCRRSGRTHPLNVIGCENMADSSSALGRQVLGLLNGPDRDYALQDMGFPDCMISRVVPQPVDDPLRLITEDYNEWTVRQDAFKGEKPAGLDAMELVTNQTARLERKLMIHNGGHAVCGYFGFHRGHTYIHEAIADPVVLEAVVGALNEIGEVVRRKHGFSRESIEEYKRDLGRRGQIADLQDQILRVIRDPIRKLGPDERLVGPARLAVEYGLPRTHIVAGIVAVLRYRHSSDAQSLLLAQSLLNEGLPATLERFSGIGRNHPLAGEIEAAWSKNDD